MRKILIAAGVFFALVVAVAFTQNGSPKYSTVTMLAQGQKLTIYVNDGSDEVRSFAMQPGEAPIKYVNALIEEGYVVDQWLFDNQAVGSNVVQTVCVLRR